MNQNFIEEPSSSVPETKITISRISFIILSIIFFIIDVGLDIVLAVQHYNDGNKTFYILTICFIGIPTIVNFGFSSYWYMTDEEWKKDTSVKQWIVRCIFLMLGLAPILRNFESLYYAWKGFKSTKSEEKKYFERRMIYESADASNLRLFEAFLECAPQLVIQIYIFAKVQSVKTFSNVYTETEIKQSISILSSLVSMSFSMTGYLRALRESLDEKKDLSLCVSIFPFLWRFFEFTSRALVLGLFASVSPHYFCLVCMVHFIIMFIWIHQMKTDFCNSQLGEIFYNAILGIIFIFCYFNPKDTPTKWRITIFYVLLFLENVVLMSVWYNYYSSYVYLKIPVTIVHFLSYFAAIFIMITYYTWFHPSRKSITTSQTTKMEEYNNASTMVNDIGKNKKLTVIEECENHPPCETYEKLICGKNSVDPQSVHGGNCVKFICDKNSDCTKLEE